MSPNTAAVIPARDNVDAIPATKSTDKSRQSNLAPATRPTTPDHTCQILSPKEVQLRQQTALNNASTFETGRHRGTSPPRDKRDRNNPAFRGIIGVNKTPKGTVGLTFQMIANNDVHHTKLLRHRKSRHSRSAQGQDTQHTPDILTGFHNIHQHQDNQCQ